MRVMNRERGFHGRYQSKGMINEPREGFSRDDLKGRNQTRESLLWSTLMEKSEVSTESEMCLDA